MKAIHQYIKLHMGTKANSNPYVAQARMREKHWSDFRDEMELIGDRLYRLRILQGYELGTVARALKMPKQRLYKIEQGTYRHFELHYLYRLAAYYDTTALDVLSVIPDSAFDGIKY